MNNFDKFILKYGSSGLFWGLWIFCYCLLFRFFIKLFYGFKDVVVNVFVFMLIAFIIYASVVMAKYEEVLK